MDDSTNKVLKEYLSLLKHPDLGCDSCIAQCYCIENNLRHDRYPQDDCFEKLKGYLKSHSIKNRLVI